MGGPHEVNLVRGSVKPVIAEVNRKEGQQVHPPRSLEAEYGVMVVYPALYDEI